MYLHGDALHRGGLLALRATVRLEEVLDQRGPTKAH